MRLDSSVATRLFRWAAEHEPRDELLGPAWITKADAWTARFRLGLPYSRPGTWMTFDRALSAAVNGDAEALASQLAALA